MPLDIVYPAALLLAIVLVKSRDLLLFARIGKPFLALFMFSLLVGIERDLSGLLRDVLKFIGNWLIFPALILSRRHKKFSLKLAQYFPLIIVFFQILQLLTPEYWGGLLKMDVSYFRAVGPFSNPNVTAYVLLVLYAIRNKPSRHFTVLILVGVILSESRSAIIGFLLVVFFRSSLKHRILALLIFLSFLPVILEFSAQTRFGVLLGTGGKEYLYNSRLGLWYFSFIEWLKSPIFGHGYGSMDRVVPIGGGLGPHNFVLYTLGSTGLVGLAILFYGLMRMYRMSVMSAIDFILVYFGVILMFNHDMFLLAIFPLLIYLNDKRSYDIC